MVTAERERMILEHMPQVRMIAGRMRKRSFAIRRKSTQSETESDGALGLIQAVDRYDGRLNCAFESFAERRIRGAIGDGARKLDLFSRRVHKNKWYLNSLYESYGSQLTGLNEGMHAKGLSQYEAAARNQAERFLQRAIGRLSEKERAVVLAYYWDERNHADIAEFMRTSADVVAQIKGRGIRKLREALTT